MNNHVNVKQRAKAFSRYALIVFIGFSLVISACKKKVATTPTPGFVYADDVYIAGHYITGGNPYPAYWKNGKRTDLKALDGITAQTGQVRAIAVNGTDVYAVGYCYPAKGQIILWKNGTPIKVTENNGSYATCLAVSPTTGMVYVGGAKQNAADKNTATYWKVDVNSSVLPTPIDVTQDKYPSTNVRAFGIALLGTTVYMTGNIRLSNANEIPTLAALWTDNGTTITESILNKMIVRNYAQ